MNKFLKILFAVLGIIVVIPALPLVALGTYFMNRSQHFALKVIIENGIDELNEKA